MNKRFIYKYFLVLSIILTSFFSIIFFSSYLYSKNNLKLYHETSYGDISDIEKLKISCEIIFSTINTAFYINQNKITSKKSEDIYFLNFNNYSFKDNIDKLNLYEYLIPVGDFEEKIEIEGTKENPSKYLNIYADLYESKIEIPGFDLSIESDKKLYIKNINDLYLYKKIYNDKDLADKEYRDFNSFINDNRIKNNSLNERIRYEDCIYYVTTGTNYFGETSIYKLTLNEYNSVVNSDDPVKYESIFDFKVSVEDTIYGMVNYENNLYLFIERDDFFEITQINLNSFEKKSLKTFKNINFYKLFFDNDNLILNAKDDDNIFCDICVIDLNKFEILTEIKKVDLFYEPEGQETSSFILSMKFKEDKIYVLTNLQFEFFDPSTKNKDRFVISEFDKSGHLIARSFMKLSGIDNFFNSTYEIRNFGWVYINNFYME